MIIAIDVGGSTVRVASYASVDSHEYLALETFAPAGSFETDVENITKAIKSFGSPPDTIGIGIPGVFDRNSGQIKILPNISSWNGHSIGKDLEAAFNVKVVLENDAVAGALGEAMWGSSNIKDFWYITWGTGLGGALVKEIESKVRVFPSELGHQVINANGKDLESFTGGGDIKHSYGTTAENLSDEKWAGIEKDLAQGIVNVLSIINTSRIVFGGGISVQQPERIEHITRHIKEKLNLFKPPQVSVAQGGENAGILGAKVLIQTDRYTIE
jgi:glucokinase